jgi:hypothetical protein
MSDEIQITEATYDGLRDRYRFEGPRIVDVKGKGLMTTYRLVGATAPANIPASDAPRPTQTV